MRTVYKGVMSYQVPEDFPTLPSNTNIPHSLTGDDLKVFSGARSNVRYVQAASGQNVGAGSNILFNMPAEPYGYIKPNSMVLRGTIQVTQAAAASTVWAFAGQPNPIAACPTAFAGTAPNIFTWYTTPSGATVPSVGAAAGSPGSNVYNGGAASLLNRISVTLPGGASMTYNQHHHWRNAVTPHVLSKPYVEGDLRQLEGGTIAVNTASGVGTAPSTLRSFCIPLDIPLFNADAAFPMLLCSGGMTIEFTTNSVQEAFMSTVASVTSYTLTTLALVYEVITVTPDFKSALMHAKKDKPYMIHVNDRINLGPVVSNSSQRFNLGVSLSSMKCVLFTEMCQAQLQGTQDNNARPLEKFYGGSQIFQYNVYRDGLQITPNYCVSDDLWFAEMNRAVGRINESTSTSAMYAVTPQAASSERTTYSRSQLLLGATMQTIDDWSFAAQGVSVDQLSIEVFKHLLTADIDGPYIGCIGLPATAGAAIPYANLYLWACFDSVVVIMPDGMCTIRR